MMPPVCDTNDAIAIMVGARGSLWTDFVVLPPSGQRDRTFAAWTRLNHAISSVQRTEQVPLCTLHLGPPLPKKVAGLR